ncbi:MFP1 attachment factor 1-like [Impatiens glandulifera]|uniref:MFP1 attachment factor 1-like n=1 Tax=Impatiens glandulifera TaxID=253017 RepID=UPI001FB0F551|nr:MFP1 attachment factor 1-like [Impatiens glandulifera]
MAEAVDESQHQIPPQGKSPVSFSIWPPTQRTRDAVTTRLIETFTAPSILSQRYGSIPQDEAEKEAHRIEREAYESVANSSATEDDGIEVLQTYSKEISKRMLEVIKGRSVTSKAADDSTVAETAAVDPSESVTDENPSAVNTES